MGALLILRLYAKCAFSCAGDHAPTSPAHRQGPAGVQRNSTVALSEAPDGTRSDVRLNLWILSRAWYEYCACSCLTRRVIENIWQAPDTVFAIDSLTYSINSETKVILPTNNFDWYTMRVNSSDHRLTYIIKSFWDNIWTIAACLCQWNIIKNVIFRWHLCWH